MGTQRDFYGPADLARLDRKIVWERLGVWGLAALTLGLCVLFCRLTTTRNAGRMELYTLVTSCLGGWIVIYLRLFGLQESLHEREHARYLPDPEKHAQYRFYMERCAETWPAMREIIHRTVEQTAVLSDLSSVSY